MGNPLRRERNMSIADFERQLAKTTPRLFKDRSMSITTGDRVYRLNQNGRPMMNSTGTGKLQGVVTEMGTKVSSVRWINPGTIDHSRTYENNANLERIDTT